MVDDDNRWTDGRQTDDGQTPDHGHPISSLSEPNGSGELKNVLLSCYHMMHQVETFCNQ